MSVHLSSGREIDERLLEHGRSRVHRRSILCVEDRDLPPWALPKLRGLGIEQ